jgi:hypothetical protein
MPRLLGPEHDGRRISSATQLPSACICDYAGSRVQAESFSFSAAVGTTTHRGPSEVHGVPGRELDFRAHSPVQNVLGSQRHLVAA